jgi:hypothetical protein
MAFVALRRAGDTHSLLASNIQQDEALGILICDGGCLCALLLHISRAAYRRLRVGVTAPRARSVESGAAVAAGPHDNKYLT